MLFTGPFFNYQPEKRTGLGLDLSLFPSLSSLGTSSKEDKPIFCHGSMAQLTGHVNFYKIRLICTISTLCGNMLVLQEKLFREGKEKEQNLEVT